MKNRLFILLFIAHIAQLCAAQDRQEKRMVNVQDTSDGVAYQIELSPIVLNDKLEILNLIKRIKDDTTFYKSYKNLNVLNYTAIVSGRMLDKKNNPEASINSVIKQEYKDGCGTKKNISENIVGKIKNKKGEWNYYTCKIFGNLFLNTGTVCGKTNIVGNKEITNEQIDKLSGVDKRVEQIKMLVFNPGKRIPDAFYFGNKVAIFDKDVQKNYDFFIDKVTYKRKECILFQIKAKEDLGFFQRSGIVIDELTTWLDAKTWEIVGKKYRLSYDLGFMEFDIKMDVEIDKYKDYLYPSIIRYSGKWHIPFYKSENGFFTILLHSVSDEQP